MMKLQMLAQELFGLNCTSTSFVVALPPLFIFKMPLELSSGIPVAKTRMLYNFFRASHQQHLTGNGQHHFATTNSLATVQSMKQL